MCIKNTGIKIGIKTGIFSKVKINLKKTIKNKFSRYTYIILVYTKTGISKMISKTIKPNLKAHCAYLTANTKRENRRRADFHFPLVKGHFALNAGHWTSSTSQHCDHTTVIFPNLIHIHSV